MTQRHEDTKKEESKKGRRKSRRREQIFMHTLCSSDVMAFLLFCLLFVPRFPWFLNKGGNNVRDYSTPATDNHYYRCHSHCDDEP